MAVTDDVGLVELDLDPCEDERWLALASRDDASVFTSPPWLRALAATYPDLGLRARVLVDPAGSPVAGLVHARIDDVLGRRIVGLPFSDFADPIGEDHHVARLIDSIAAEGHAVTLKSLRLEGPTVPSSFAHRGEVGWHAIDVTGSEDELWARLRGSARRNVRAAMRGELEVETLDTLDAVHRFYDLHVQVRTAKYRLLPQPRDFFSLLWEQFAPSGAIRVSLARHEGADIGGILVLDWGDVAFYKFNASLAEQLALRPNDLLLWTTMNEARERGLRSLDLGVSDLDQEGLVRYKRKFATEEGRVNVWGLDRPAPASTGELRALFGELSGLLSDPELPAEVAAEGGRLLYRYFC